MDFVKKLHRNMANLKYNIYNNTLIVSNKNLFTNILESKHKIFFNQADPEPALNYIKFLKNNNKLDQLFENNDPMPESDR